MREFFHGWRRKLGCVTLVMACVFVGGWLRSSQVTDAIVMSTGGRWMDVIASDGGLLKWSDHLERAPRYFDWLQLQPSWFNDRMQVNWQLQSCGFGIGEFEDPKVGRIWSIPYWSITVPLTLLSAYLILWQPRKRTETDHA